MRSEPPRYLMQVKGIEISITLKWEHVCLGGRAVRRPAVLGWRKHWEGGENEKDTGHSGRSDYAGACWLFFPE